MPLKVLDTGNVLRTMTSLKIWDGSTLRPLRTLKVLGTDGVSLVTVASFAVESGGGGDGGGSTPTLSLSSSGDVSASARTSIITSDPVTVTPSGGVSPYTYSWLITEGTATINSPSLATTTFRSAALAIDETDNAVAECTCTDASGATASVEVALLFTRRITADVPFG